MRQRLAHMFKQAPATAVATMAGAASVAAVAQFMILTPVKQSGGDCYGSLPSICSPVFYSCDMYVFFRHFSISLPVSVTDFWYSKSTILNDLFPSLSEYGVFHYISLYK
jgi:hypothetical protein